MSKTAKIGLAGFGKMYSVLWTLRKTHRIFTAWFIKKDGSLRKMTAMFGCKKHLNGGKKSYVPEEKGMVTVWDFGKEAYRTINLNTLVALKADKVYYFLM